ncbi:MAG TPA: hypothetical protein VFT06_04320 [Flavisolibacter sp.]|nr:hypothetical protein [Flavisolibacter sp.]
MPEQEQAGKHCLDNERPVFVHTGMRGGLCAIPWRNPAGQSYRQHALPCGFSNVFNPCL